MDHHQVKVVPHQYACPRPLPYELLQKRPTHEECEPPNDITLFEDTPLYSLIAQRSRASIKQAYNLVCELRHFQIKKRSETDRSTYLHHIVNQAPAMFEKYSTVADLIPLVYKLCLKGVVINAQNKHGNTCLHLACLRPHASPLCIHLLRLGVDPCIANAHGCRVVYTYNEHNFYIVKGESSVQCGLWWAVQAENVEAVKRLMRTWCRVGVARNKTIFELADDTSNRKLVEVLNAYRLTNEMACAAFACDIPLIHHLAKQGPINWKQRDEAFQPARPLTVSLGELGFWAKDVIKVLIEYGALPVEEFLEEEIEDRKAFEQSEFYLLIEKSTRESLTKASDLILEKKVDLKLKSYTKDQYGWTYLHYVVHKFNVLNRTDSELARLLVRCIYRLALAGINVSARTSSGDTALIMSAKDGDQVLMNHLIRIGCDSSIPNRIGECVTVERYNGRFKLVLSRTFRAKDAPGLPAAVKLNSPEMAERWLKSWARVNCMLGDRTLMDVAKSRNQTEIVGLMRRCQHINEFVCATLASDYNRVMTLLSLGEGDKKVNAIDEFYPTGHILNFRCEFIARPLIISAIELCTPQIVDFLLNFNANLSDQYEEKPPCGPLAFWSFQNHVSNEITQVVVNHAEVTLRDEMGCTMLHRIVVKSRTDGKMSVVRKLLERNINIAARDEDGHTARDYVLLYPYLEKSGRLKQILDDHVLELVKLDNLIELEQLLLNSYDHISDIRDSLKKKNAMEIAEIKQYYEMQMFLKKMDAYVKEIKVLQTAIKEGDMVAVSKHAMERKCAQCTDKGGRTLLHLAVLFERLEIIKFLLDHFPNLINRTDNSNLTVYDYVKQLKNPILKRFKSRSRLWRDYTPSFDLIERERARDYEQLINPEMGNQNISNILIAEVLQQQLTEKASKKIRDEIEENLFKGRGTSYLQSFFKK